MVWTFTKVNVQSMRKIAQMFVYFSESSNFKSVQKFDRNTFDIKPNYFKKQCSSSSFLLT